MEPFNFCTDRPGRTQMTKLVRVAGVDFPSPASQFPKMKLFASRTAEHLHCRRFELRASALGYTRVLAVRKGLPTVGFAPTLCAF